MKKRNATLKKIINKTQLFHFIPFFQFSKEVLQNGRKVPKNVKNSTLMTPGGQNMTLRYKCHGIESFATSSNVIRTNMNIKKWAGGLQWWAALLYLIHLLATNAD